MAKSYVAFARLALVPPLFWLLTDGGNSHYWAALSVFMFIGLSGLADGYLRPGSFSPFTAMLHVLADRLLMLVSMAGLLVAGLNTPIVLAAGLVLISRDVIVGTLNEALPGSLNTQTQALEKGRVALQVIGFSFLIAPNQILPDLNVPSRLVGALALVLAAVLAVITLTSYWRGAVASFRTEP